DALRADVRAALGDVAQPDPRLVGDQVEAVDSVERVHVQRGQPDHEPRTEVPVLQTVVAEDVTDVLAHEALDALAKLAHPVGVLLGDQIIALGQAITWCEWWDPLVDLVVPRHVRDEVTDQWERAQRLDRY